MAGKIATRIDALEKRLRQLKTQQQRLEARKRNKQARQDRRIELRKRLLVGAAVLTKVERGEIELALLHRWLDGELTKDEDRQLLGLSPTNGPPA